MHGHHHDHPGTPEPTGGGRRWPIGIGLNLAFVVLEVIFGVYAHSIALIADAAHNVSDVLGLLLAWGATALALRPPSSRHTYGLRRTTLLATLANTVLILLAAGGVIWEAAKRLGAHPPVAGKVVMAVAGAGVLLNGSSALLFLRGRARDANLRAAFGHLASDAIIALSVMLSAGVIVLTGWTWLDPAISLAVGAVIVFGTWSLLRDAVGSVVDAVPAHVNLGAVRLYLRSLPGVTEVHDLHVWPLSTTETALTAHLVLPWASCSRDFLRDACRHLHDEFKIEHATLQIEPAEAPELCHLAPDHVV
jgi:cobalt-zinc-cadmium efflux system protein